MIVWQWLFKFNRSGGEYDCIVLLEGPTEEFRELSWPNHVNDQSKDRQNLRAPSHSELTDQPQQRHDHHNALSAEKLEISGGPGDLE